MISQKSLSTLEERISNARHSIVLGEKTKYDHILLIDDAIGSGTTIFETAKKLKELKLASKIIGYAVIGSYQEFEVTKECDF